MDMNLLYAILIALIPVVFTILISRLYNIIHGIISFFTASALLILCLTSFGESLPAEVLAGCALSCSFYDMINGFLVEVLALVGLNGLGNVLDAGQLLLVILVVLFLVSQIISSVIRRRRVRRIKQLKKEAKLF